MKRLASSDSFGALMSICPNSTDDDNHNQENSTLYSGGMMLEGLDEDVEEFGRVSEKKRRLRVDQVKALEKNFEVENKLEPERKVKLAQDLGLQPRQVAVWFQNRRARWKTKQLERDYGVLKTNHDALKAKFEALQKDNQSLLNEIDELKSKMKEEGKIYIKEEEKRSLGDTTPPQNQDSSDSSAIVNNESMVDHELLGDCCYYQPQLVKMEEHNFLGEECCSSLFCEDQAPTLHWYSSDEWN